MTSTNKSYFNTNPTLEDNLVSSGLCFPDFSAPLSQIMTVEFSVFAASSTGMIPLRLSQSI